MHLSLFIPWVGNACTNVVIIYETITVELVQFITQITGELGGQKE